MVYNYCTTVNTQKNSKNKNGGTAFPTNQNPANQVMNPISAKSGGAELIGQELYKRLKKFLENYLIELLKVSESHLGACAPSH